MQVVVNDLLTTYQKTGTGPVLLCVHGWMHDHKSFDELTTELQKTFTVIALDLPNFGTSQATNKVISIDDYSNFLAAFAEKLGINDYALAGHSMGGQIAISAVSQGILNPKQLILIDSAGVRDDKKISKLLLRNASKLTRHVLPKAIKSKFYQAIGSDYRPDLTDIHKKIIAQTLTTDVQVLADKITIPTLLMYGSQDTSTPPAYGKKLAARIKNSRFETIDGQQHWPHQTAPAKVAKCIKDFLV